MKVIKKSRIPKRSKTKIKEIKNRVAKYMTENQSERNIMEFEFAHFSPDAIMRKTIDVIA